MNIGNEQAVTSIVPRRAHVAEDIRRVQRGDDGFRHLSFEEDASLPGDLEIFLD